MSLPPSPPSQKIRRGRLPTIRTRRSRTAPAVLLALAAGCASPNYPLIEGDWLVTESFADDVHQLSCDSEGVFTITQAMSDDPGESRPGATFNGSLVNDNDCSSVDGPFTYIGQGALAEGLISRRPFTVRFDAAVNDADCSYVGLIRGEDSRATEIEGTLECMLEQAGVLFEFEGEWTAERILPSVTGSNSRPAN